MPLRDHFRPPISKKSSWEAFHGTWPVCIVQQLRNLLPVGFIAEPHIRLGTVMEIDVGALEEDEAIEIVSSHSNASSGMATATWAASSPAIAVDTEPPDEYEYEVCIYDIKHERQLVAAIEFVSPANKDRPQSRDAFVAKCAALLRKGVAVSIVDLVTNRQFNLYAQLMTFIEHPDPVMTAIEPAIYAASCRWPTLGVKARLETWPHALTIGQPLPLLPLWLSEALVLPLDLEKSYEKACHDSWITD